MSFASFFPSSRMGWNDGDGSVLRPEERRLLKGFWSMRSMLLRLSQFGFWSFDSKKIGYKPEPGIAQCQFLFFWSVVFMVSGQ